MSQGINVTQRWPPAITGALDLVRVTMRSRTMVTFLCESAIKGAKAPVIIKSEATVPAYPTFEEIPYSNHWWLINPSSIIAVIVPSNASRLLSISASVCTPDNTPLVRDIRSTPLT